MKMKLTCYKKHNIANKYVSSFLWNCASSFAPLTKSFFSTLRFMFVFMLAMFSLATMAKTDRMNVIYILTDDQRYDEMGFLNPVISTPNMDKLAKEGVHFANSFVTTSLCSPSRATILTGLYMHNHGVVDNNAAPKDGTIFFPEYMQKAGYETALVGKWHMGEHASANRKLDDPQPGFDHWVSLAGQGEYYPINKNGKSNKIKVNAMQVNQQGYITNELND